MLVSSPAMQDELRGAEATCHIAIIGAGFSGVAMAIQLKKAGIHDFVVFEAADEVGGTWRDNVYPGCACDVPSHLYSYSFEPNAHWSRVYGEQGEIWAYLRRCVEKYGLRPHLRLGAKIRRAVFDEASGTWQLTTAQGETCRAKVVISGTGPLARPVVPELPGLERFAGRTFHSARWDHGYDLRGKRVAVVGTGASAIQFVPQIAKVVEVLHLFQRTPPWVMPKLDRAFTEREKARFARYPALDKAYRALVYWVMELRGAGFVVEPKLLALLEKLAVQHVRASVKDPELRRKVTPSYRMGCKRILISNDYYPALGRPNVELVTHGVREVEAHAIVTEDGERRPVDAIVFGTGFDVSDFLGQMEIRGLGGKGLDEAWQEGAEAYHGVAIAGFPNLFLLLGPNSGLGHNSMIFMIEAQVHFVLQCLKLLREKDARYLSVRPPAQRTYNDGLQDRSKNTVWMTGCRSWYLDEQGRNFSLWPGFTVEYWLRTRRVRPSDFEAVA
ncbi:flavin-containing monooxygenase [Chondromyces apiculatus]|uniref:Cyclohexanone monooxygenase n=1 Tax=Chondromyces apiculatus DSM 436 TaxID=1192034 RepID=A0A017T1B6_9BACT|nr:NAD(P)/FAD-dependent oxidoreductase [Chondromyces apiculatus]EYF02625.1 Cyclohexanone monooxygenase [Chondromyces apiculatus DSM 436]